MGRPAGAPNQKRSALPPVRSVTGKSALPAPFIGICGPFWLTRSGVEDRVDAVQSHQRHGVSLESVAASYERKKHVEMMFGIGRKQSKKLFALYLGGLEPAEVDEAVDVPAGDSATEFIVECCVLLAHPLHHGCRHVQGSIVATGVSQFG